MGSNEICIERMKRSFVENVIGRSDGTVISVDRATRGHASAPANSEHSQKAQLVLRARNQVENVGSIFVDVCVFLNAPVANAPSLCFEKLTQALRFAGSQWRTHGYTVCSTAVHSNTG